VRRLRVGILTGGGGASVCEEATDVALGTGSGGGAGGEGGEEELALAKGVRSLITIWQISRTPRSFVRDVTD